jgi:hypothetical protein
MHNRQLPRHRQHRPFTRRVRQLRRRAAHQRHNTCGVDDTPSLLAVAPHAYDGVLATVPNTLDIDVLREIPDLFRRVYGVRVLGVHDAGVVEDDINTTPIIKVSDHGRDIRLFAHVTLHRLHHFYMRYDFSHFGEGLVQGGLGDVGHQDCGAFTGEENGRLQANAPEAVRMVYKTQIAFRCSTTAFAPREINKWIWM